MREMGLTTEEANRSREQQGSNALTCRQGRGFFRRFLENFGDPIIRILLIALGVNVVLLFRRCDWYESAGIALSVLVATLVSTLSEQGSEAAFSRIREEAERTMCRVWRDGRLCELPVAEVVVGDVVAVAAGEGVPADGELVRGSVRVSLSALNGESREVRRAADGERELPRGAVICAGEGVMTVQRVGDQTLYGRLAQEVQEETRESPLKARLTVLARQLSRLGYAAAVLVGLSDLLHGLIREYGMTPSALSAAIADPAGLFSLLLHAVTLAITVVVVAVPEGLPMMITVVLSANMRRMLRDRVLVRKLVGVETSGSLNILFTDKTGTLTRGEPEVCRAVQGDGEGYDSRDAARKMAPQWWRYVACGCCDNNGSRRSGSLVLGSNATDRALLRFGGRSGREPSASVPFDSARKWAAAQPQAGGEWLIKGAPDRLLPACRWYVDRDGYVQPLADRRPLTQAYREMTARAMRVLALAVCRKAPTDGRLPELTLVALLGLRDDLRPEAKPAVAALRRAGIQTVMVTGDSRETACAIAREAGVLLPGEEGTGVITAAELERLPDDALRARLPALRVVARAVPTDKSRLIRVSQQAGLVVGMTGDGVNDAPALKVADVGFAMGSGTVVAREAGDIVILDDNIASIVRAVLYGRTIFKSIRKFLVFQLTMNLCAVGVSLIGPFIGIDAPVTVIQMLWINLIMDALAGLAFAGEPPLPEYLEEPPKSREEPVLTGGMLAQIGGMGLYTVGLCTVFLAHPAVRGMFGGCDRPVAFLTGFFALFIFCGICNSFNARTDRLNPTAHLRKNPAFVWIMAAVSVIQLLMIYFGGSMFRTAPLRAGELFRVFLLAATVWPADLLRKLLCGRKGDI